ncbi:MAG: carboxypeptidase regulatory-like domain-containing protein [Candidatus Omnitrophica bacterium]|nr:carboxypeptidase regulatory-like domain-containing protein [Candidatus Omnitrophota bacterium]
MPTWWETIAAGADVAVDQLVNITGHVVDQATGQPVPNAHVYQDFGFAISGTTTDAQGAYDLLCVPAVNVHVTHVAYEPLVQAAPGAASTVNFALVPAAYDLPEVEVTPDSPGDDTGDESKSGFGWVLGGLALLLGLAAWKMPRPGSR